MTATLDKLQNLGGRKFLITILGITIACVFELGCIWFEGFRTTHVAFLTFLGSVITAFLATNFGQYAVQKGVPNVAKASPTVIN